MDRATRVAVIAAAVYAIGTLAVGFWVFWGDALLLGATAFTAVVLTPLCFFVTRSAVDAQQTGPN